MAPLTIRDAADADSAAMAALLSELGYPSPIASIAGRLARMRREGGQHVLVAEADGSVVGLATLVLRHVIVDDAPFARLSALVVAATHRGAGIGRALVEAAERIACEAGATTIEVTGAARRAEAHRFYEAVGYSERRRRYIKEL